MKRTTESNECATIAKRHKCNHGFQPGELQQALMPLLKKLYYLEPEACPFRRPVDPVFVGCLDYLNIVKKPMDLSTIKSKLDAGEYKIPQEFCNDVCLMFHNAWLYNKETSGVYKCCTKLSEIFQQEIGPVMKALGSCVEEHYDLCVPCHSEKEHNHKMERLGLDLDVDQQQTQGERVSAPSNPQEERRLKIQRCIQSLVHATYSHDAGCQLPSCAKMKRVVEHTKNCKRKTSGGCRICQELIHLCCYHAKHCQELECNVPFCRHIKFKLRQQQAQQGFLPEASP